MPKSQDVDADSTGQTGPGFLESSRLEVLVPHASNIDIAELIQSQDVTEEDSSDASGIEVLANIPQRRSLFYDESVPVYVILELHPEFSLTDNQYQAYISRVAISLEVVAVEGQNKLQEQNSKPNEGIHVLYEAILNEENSAPVLLNYNGRRLSTWKIMVPLGHPRTRLSSPKVLFAVVASLKLFETQTQTLNHDYLTSRNVFGVNLLEAYGDDFSLGGTRPQLSALRVSRVSPAARIPQEPSSSISYRSKRMFHLFPAINVRLRHSHVGTGATQSVIASLDIDITAGDVVLNKVGLILAGGKAELIGGPIDALLPMACRSHDEVTFLYSLESLGPINLSNTASNSKPVTLSLEATVLVSKRCNPRIKSIWNTLIDISNPKLPTTRTSRAMSIPISYGTTLSSSSGISTTHSLVPAPTLQFSAQFQISALHEANGLVMTFSGPEKVYVGEVFTWTVFVVNRSPHARKLALVVPHKRWKAECGKALPPVVHDGTGYVMDEGAVYTAHRSQILEPAELVCLMNDVRVGPLAPLACHTTELRFIALTAGVLNVEAVRIVDITTSVHETTECRDLPSIISIRR